ncbi:Spore coat protein SA [bacterium HR18]|nr:Spore coat protein SA [bacterium HR18]
MKVLALHTRYQQPGGEDSVFAAEVALLWEKGHEVHTFTFYNRDLEGLPLWKQASFTLWNWEAYVKMREAIRAYRPQIVHVHNTFPLASPAVMQAKVEGVTVVHTLHNYRLICPGALLMRDGQVCEECVGRAIPWPGVVHGCWRGSRLQTSVVAAMLTLHRAMKTWTEQVDCYIALTEFARRKFIEGGLPAEKIVVKPNFVDPDPGEGRHEGDYALFVGRLSPEKGVRVLLQAWRLLKGMPLKVVGDGPLRAEVEEFVGREGLTEIEVLGRKSREEVFRWMQEARVLVFPSECYEGFPMTIAEAFACGLPVVASRLGAMAEIVEEGRTGLLFEPGDAEDLAAKMEWAWAHPRELAEMGREARREYEQKYTAEKNYEMLMAIYERARATASGA